MRRFPDDGEGDFYFPCVERIDDDGTQEEDRNCGAIRGDEKMSNVISFINQLGMEALLDRVLLSYALDSFKSGAYALAVKWRAFSHTSTHIHTRR